MLYPNNVAGEPRVPADVRVVSYDPAAAIPTEHHDADILVSWAIPPALMRDAAARLGKVRWVQSLAAGTDVEQSAGFAEDVTISSGRSLHDATVAEHTLALILAGLRGLHQLVAAQPEHRWRSDLGGPRVEGRDGRVETLSGARVLIWGFGSIGQTVAPLLSALGAEVTGVARAEGERAGFPVVPAERLPALLPDTDVLVMILPATDETEKALDARMLALLPARAWVVNVGRGATVDEQALAESLRAGKLGGAALDVFRTEPLPADSPLWDLPNVIISPHAAGGRPREAAALVEENLAAYLAGRPLRNVVRQPGGG
jgi:phosphoglycerate dehydrogenase-like enzyme